MARSGRGGFASIESVQVAAEGYMAQGRLREAEEAFRELAAQTHAANYEYDDWLSKLANIYKELHRSDEMGAIYLYLHYFDLANDAFAGEDKRPQQARVAEVMHQWENAAQLYEGADMVVHAAVAREKAEQFRQAAVHWESLIRDSRLQSLPYEQALVYFNYGMALQSENPEDDLAKRALVDSQRLLEQVADDFETKGQRERAFDCYLILVKMGRDSKQYENLAEGYLNSIRVLRDDGLKFFVLQYYEDFISLSIEWGELHAASTLYQEAADFSSRNGLPYHRDYQAKAAATWALCAETYLEEDAPIELVENALLAAISSYSSVGDYRQVQGLFVRLGELELGERKVQRYQAIASRYDKAEVANVDSPQLPDYLKKPHAYADIWFSDLLEWELGGSPMAVAMATIGNLGFPDTIRRRALVIVLTIGNAANQGVQAEPETLATVAELLGELQIYAALYPLEVLYQHPDSLVRTAAIRALRFLFFKRSFGLIRSALVDVNDEVRTAALEALRGLHFPHAFNPLVGIYRESEVPAVRAVALESIGKIQSIEAGEFLLSVLRQEEGDLRAAAISALSSLDNADLVPIVRQYFLFETNAEVRAALDSLLKSMRA